MTSTGREDIASKVRDELARQGKTHRAVAEVLGIDQSSVTLRISGKRPFRAEELAKLAEALAVPVGQFYGESPASAA